MLRKLGRTIGDLVWGAAGVVFLLIVAVFILGFLRSRFSGTVVGRAAAKVEGLAGLQG